VSGDGLFHEFLNGAAKRPDFNDFVKKIPFGIIPGGSGNGLAATLQCPNPLTAAFTICKGGKRQMDIAQTWQEDSSRWIFLTVAWGMIADADVGSEGWRWMGPTLRYLAAPAYRVLKRRRYSGRLWMLPCDEEQGENEKIQQWPEFGEIQPPLPSNPPSTQKAKVGEKEWFDYLPDEVEREVDGKKWRVIEGDFTMVTASLVQSIAIDCMAAPFSKLDDGAIDIVYTTDADASKIDLISFLLTLDAKEVDLSSVRYRKAKAFMLESLAEKGRFALDGELTSYTPIRCEVVPRFLTVLAP